LGKLRNFSGKELCSLLEKVWLFDSTTERKSYNITEENSIINNNYTGLYSLTCSYIPKVLQQLPRKHRTINSHNTLLRTSKTQQIDTPIPDNFLIDHRKCLVDVAL
jgi:hypothetical protein